MPTSKEVVWAILAITLASVIVMVVVAPLDGSAYAAGVRENLAAAALASESAPVDEQAGFTATLTQIIVGDARTAEATTPLSVLLLLVGSVLRLGTLMGVTGLMTLVVLAATNRFKKRSRAAVG